MAHTIPFVLVCILFLVRDARLVASRPRLFFACVPIILATIIGCATVAESLSVTEVRQLTQDHRYWTVAVVVDGFQLFRSLRLSRLGAPADWGLLLPGAVVCLALVNLCHFVLTRVDGGTGMDIGLAVGSAWVLAVGLIQRVRVLRTDPRPSIRFVTVAHFVALASVPALALPETASGTLTFDWIATGGVLGAVVLLVGASVVWHQLRRRSRSAPWP